MNNERGTLVDAETQQAIQESGDKIIDAIKEDLRDLKDYIREHTASQIKPIEKDIERLTKDIAELYNIDRQRIVTEGKTEARIADLEGNRTGRDTAEERGNRRREVNYSAKSIIIAVGGGIIGLVGLYLTFVKG